MTSSGGPLAGLRVLELGGIGPVPFAGMLLADLGADVLRIDRPGAQGLPGVPVVGDHAVPVKWRPDLELMHRGRRSAVLDLRHPDAAHAVAELAASADVLIEGFRPGVAERLGVGPEALAAVNPRLVYGRMTGWGQAGPLAGTAGHDITFIAPTGVLAAIGERQGPPQVPLNLVGDFAGGSLFLVMGVLAALLERRESGRGQVVDAAIVDGTAALTTMFHGLIAAGLWRDARGGNLIDGSAPQYGVYATADGRHMAVGAIESPFYMQLLRGLGLDAADLPPREDPAGWPGWRRRIADAFASRTQAQWCQVFDGTDACVSPVLSMTEAPGHPHLAARGTFTTVDGVVQPTAAPRFSRTPAAAGRPPSRPGAHTRQALADWGVSDVDALLAAGVAVQT